MRQRRKVVTQSVCLDDLTLNAFVCVSPQMIIKVPLSPQTVCYCLVKMGHR